jgi:hypothetical protein
MDLYTKRHSFNLFILGKALFLLISVFLFAEALNEYSGKSYIYVLFTASSYALLLFGFRKNAIFFDTFIGIFFWLGFWLKLTVRVAYMDGNFNQAVGGFNGSGEEFDQALLITSCGFLGLLTASFIREKLLFVYPPKITGTSLQGLFIFYKKYRKSILFGFVILIVLIGVSNIYFGFYQRGSIARTILPYGLNGIYTWLLMFGLASFSALVLKFEYLEAKKTSYLVAVISLVEIFLSNVSLLSRGMILNGSALIYGMIKSVKRYETKLDIRFFVKCSVIFIVLFASSVLIVNSIRAVTFSGQSEQNRIIKTTVNSSSVLFLDRWVGIEGVMAVSSYPERGWGLWQDAWKEGYSENEMSFYDNNLITSPYIKTDKSKHHFISLPGIIAFCFYPGSYLLLFGCLFLSGIGASIIELIAYKWGGQNIILCALLSQVVAFRFASFGYVPAQSYLLFGTILLNIFMIYLANKILTFWFNAEDIKGG